MSKHLLRQLPPLRLLERLVEAQQSSAPLQAVPGHFELVHGVDVLDMQLDAGSVGRFRGPHVQVFMSSGFKVQGVIAVV